MHISVTVGLVCSRGSFFCFHKGYCRKPWCKNGFNPSIQKDVPPPPPKLASSSQKLGIRTLQLHSAQGEGQYLQSDLQGPLPQIPLREEQLRFSFMLESLDWNKQLQPITTDGWEGGEVSIVINPLEMGSIGKVRICYCWAEIQCAVLTAYCSLAICTGVD